MTPDDLTQLCREVLANPAWWPSPRDPNDPSKGLITHCGEAVAHIARAYGYNGFNGLLANRIIEKMDDDKSWLNMPLPGAQLAANNGHLCIIGKKDIPHGHVCVVIPGEAVMSGEWGCPCPVVVNVGKENSWGKSVNFIWPVHDAKPFAWLYVPRDF